MNEALQSGEINIAGPIIQDFYMQEMCIRDRYHCMKYWEDLQKKEWTPQVVV